MSDFNPDYWGARIQAAAQSNAVSDEKSETLTDMQIMCMRLEIDHAHKVIPSFLQQIEDLKSALTAAQRERDEARETLAMKSLDGTDKLRAEIERLHAEVESLLTTDDRTLRAEVERLRKIAAHVPARVYIKAKEDAGFGTQIRALSQEPQG